MLGRGVVERRRNSRAGKSTQNVAPQSSAALPADASLQRVAQLSGKPVGEVRVVTGAGEVISENPPELPCNRRSHTTSEEIRAAVRQLFALGDYADVVVEASETAAETANANKGGTALRLDFLVTRNLFVGVIRIDGLKEPPSEATAYASLRLKVGDPYSEEALNDAVSNLKDALQQDGLYQAEVKADVVADSRESHHMNINFSVVRVAGKSGNDCGAEFHSLYECGAVVAFQIEGGENVRRAEIAARRRSREKLSGEAEFSGRASHAETPIV